MKTDTRVTGPVDRDMLKVIYSIDKGSTNKRDDGEKKKMT